MTITYRVLGQSNPAATTDATLYTVPAGNSAVASTLTICNQSGAAANIRVAIRPSGITLASNSYIAYDTILRGNDTISYTIGLTLAATDVITVYANTATVSFNLFGSEIY
jgi:hypothetical protein